MAVIAISDIKHGEKGGEVTRIAAGDEVKGIGKDDLKALAESGAVANAGSRAARKRLTPVDEDVDTEEEVDEESEESEGNTGANNPVNQP